MGKEKICFLVDADFPPDEQGTSLAHLNLSQKLVEIGYNIYIINYIKKNTFFSILKYQIFKISSGIHILNNNYDIIITPLWVKQSISRYILRYFVRRPYLIIIHGSDFFQSIYPKSVNRGVLFKMYVNLLKGCLKIVIDGSSGIISSLDIFVSMNFFKVDKNKFRELGFFYTNFKKPLNDGDIPWKKDKLFHILFYGRFDESKGILYLLNAILKVIKHSNNVKFHLVGDGPLKREVLNFIDQNQLSEYVVIHGYIPHKRIISFILAADCVVNPIVWGAGTGTVALEVLSQKKPLILGDANITIRNLYKKYKCFLLVKPYNADDIADKIIMVMDNPILVSNLKFNIEKLIINELDDEIIKKKIINIIEESKIYYNKFIK